MLDYGWFMADLYGFYTLGDGLMVGEWSILMVHIRVSSWLMVNIDG